MDAFEKYIRFGEMEGRPDNGPYLPSYLMRSLDQFFLNGLRRFGQRISEPCSTPVMGHPFNHAVEFRAADLDNLSRPILEILAGSFCDAVESETEFRFFSTESCPALGPPPLSSRKQIHRIGDYREMLRSFCTPEDRDLEKYRDIRHLCWMMSGSQEAKTRTLKCPSTGQYFWQVGLTPDSPNTLLGIPIVKALAGYPYVALGNFTEALTPLSVGSVRVLRDPYQKKKEGKVVFSITSRVNMRITNPQAYELFV